jgi:hypothetical protein
MVACSDDGDNPREHHTDLVLASVDDGVRAFLEAIMASGTYEYQSDFARRYYGQGKSEGGRPSGKPRRPSRRGAAEAWTGEIRRRVDRALAGEATGAPWPELRDKLRGRWGA